MCIVTKWQIGTCVFTHLTDYKSKCNLFCSSDVRFLKCQRETFLVYLQCGGQLVI